jgi:hypothetical protein
MHSYALTSREEWHKVREPPTAYHFAIAGVSSLGAYSIARNRKGDGEEFEGIRRKVLA